MVASWSEHESGNCGAELFKTTHWSVVILAGQGASPQAAAALEKLCRAYWFPLYAYVRRHGHSPEEAKDLTQEFFARLIEKHWVADADQGKGRFRTFLLTALRRFLANEWRSAHAARRGGDCILIPLDETAEARYAQELATDLTPERTYERHWALSLFDQALARLRHEYAVADKARHYDALKEFLSGEPGEGDYARVGAQLHMSQAAVATAVCRLRQHYRGLVREEIAHTVNSPDEVEDEMRWLLAALG
jgi:RNA polymerase sigma factor (sigma-70 family)